jgi:hypothetical protein
LFHEVPLRSQKIGCWCAISRKRIVGPIFFSETVTAEKYQEMTLQFISLLNEEERFYWLQQDGATSHTANSTMEMLKQLFDIKKCVATAISRPNTLRLLSLGLSEARCVLKSSSNSRRIKTKHRSCHIEYFPRNFKESSAKHGDTCEYMLRRKWRSFSTFTVKSCNLILNMFLCVINCFNETRPTDCPYTPWVV